MSHHILEILGQESFNKSKLGLKYEAMLSDKQDSVQPAPELRPSSMPLCSILVLEKWIQHKQGLPRELEWTQDFYCDVGTTLHSICEKWMGRRGNLFGNWKCVSETCKLRNKPTNTPSSKSKCPECGSIRHYVELEVKYKGITGHIDVVVETRDGYIIGDYKTSSLKNIGRPAKPGQPEVKPSPYLVNKKYVAQVMTYAYIFRRLYKKRVLQASLLFVARDDPKVFREVSLPWTRDNSERVKLFLAQQTESFLAAKKSIETGDPKWVYEARMCQHTTKTDQDYYKKSVKPFFFRDCPWYKTCIVGVNITKCKVMVEGRFKKLGLVANSI